MHGSLLLAFLTVGCGSPEGPALTPPAAPIAEAPAPAAPEAEAPTPAPEPAKPPTDHDLRCLLVFTEEAANEAFQTIGLGAPEGCKFEGVSTTHSQMKVRWETPPFQVENSDKNIVDFLVVPTPCAGNYEVEPSGSELSLKDIDGSARACPNQWAQLVQLVQNEKLPNPVSVRAP